MAFGDRDLRAFCRTVGSVAVAFNSVSTYSDDGTPVMGLLDQPMQIKLAGEGGAGVAAELPELRLPYNAFSPMPTAGAAITVGGVGYTVTAPTAEDDGAFLCYCLKATS